MATWKKVVVSGSAISQLQNDSNYLSSTGQGILSASAAGTSQGQIKLNGVDVSVTGLSTSSKPTFAAVTASLKGNVIGNVTGNVTGNLTGTASTASYVAGADVKGAVALATLATTANTASFVNSNDVEFIGGNGQTLTAVSASLALRATNAANANYSASFVGTSGQNGVVFSSTGTGLNTIVSATVPNLGTDDNVTFATASITQNLSVGGAIATVGNVTVGGDLIVNGATTTLNTTNLNVEDQFILLNSGSVAADGGLVVNGAGSAIGWDQSAGRWALDYTGATATQTAIASDAFVSSVVTTDDANYRKNGNIRVQSGEIYIYVE